MTAANQIVVFDRALLRRRRNRAVAKWADHSALFNEISEQLQERLLDVKRDFKSVLDLGAQNTALANSLRQKGAFVASADLSEKKLQACEGCAVIVDEEFLPFAAQSFDLVISNGNLHWVNDLPGALAQIKNILRPDGLFLAAVLGGQTLHELRSCLLEAELAVTGGVSPRLSPTIELQTASGLLQRAGFVLPVADSETITLTYPHMFALMHDLRGMGEANLHLHRLRHPTRRAVFEQAALLYQERHTTPDGQIAASFEVLFLHGWA